MDDRLFDPTPTLSVSEVLSRARVVIERAFGDETWVAGEIQALRRTDSHVYFDLVEGRDDGSERIRAGHRRITRREFLLQRPDGRQVRRQDRGRPAGRRRRARRGGCPRTAGRRAAG